MGTDRERLAPHDARRIAGIIDRVTEYLTAKNEVRDLTLSRSRSLIRFCANSIRAAHRHEYDEARALLAEAQEAARTVQADASAYPDIYHAGYLQDALKELAEASIVLAIVTGQPIPDPDELGIEYAAYLNGLAEAMGEMRRYALDSMRRDDIAAAEALLELIDARGQENERPATELSAREQDVLALLVEGLTNRQIAYRLHVSESTAKQYVRGILSKLNVSSRTEAVAMAVQQGLVG